MIEKELDLLRISWLEDKTFGVLKQDGVPFAVTVERPWKNNQATISCIPVGRYKVVRCRNSPDYGFADSPKFGNTFQVFAVPGRGNILFHKGNLSSDSHGCIIVGEAFDPINGVDGISNSAHGWGELMERMKDVDEFYLNVKDAVC